MHGSSGDRRALEREALRNVINQWNANRLDLFELSEPNEVSKSKDNFSCRDFSNIVLIKEAMGFKTICGN